MTPSKKLLKRLIEKHGTDSDKISHDLTKYDNIQRSIRGFYNKIERVQHEIEKKIEDIQKEIRKERKLCDHPDTQYYGDPAGGSSGFTECLICGATL